MPVIKRYPNRKLYDTEARRYTTLEGIGALIREGQDVQVVDHTTGDDLTSVTLTQVMLELEKRRGGFLPQTVLTMLIQAGGDTLSNLRRSLASPLNLASHVDEEIERRVQALARRGDLAAGEARRLRDQLLARGPGPAKADPPSDEEIEQALLEHGVPTGADLQPLAEELERLEALLEGA
jgi:polyhydroxyalkanoate synthesis repressor PhaR